MEMKQKLLTDIELDVHELKFLMDTFSKEPTQTLSELLKRSILRMQDRLEPGGRFAFRYSGSGK